MGKQFAIKEVVNTWLSKYTDDSPICYVDYASDSSFSFESERLDIRGGQGNFLLCSMDHTKKGTFKLDMPLVDLGFLAQLTGQAITLGTANIPTREVLTVASGAVHLAATPVSGTLSVYILSNGRDYGTEQTSGSSAVLNQYTLSGQTVTLNATSCADASRVICEYDYAAPATTNTITFTANNFPEYMKINGIGLWYDEYAGTNKTVVFEVMKAKPKPNFSITQKSTEATMLSMEFDLYTVDDTNGDKVYLKTYQLA
jgi:hypothetical protein